MSKIQWVTKNDRGSEVKYTVAAVNNETFILVKIINNDKYHCDRLFVSMPASYFMFPEASNINKSEKIALFYPCENTKLLSYDELMERIEQRRKPSMMFKTYIDDLGGSVDNNYELAGSLLAEFNGDKATIGTIAFAAGQVIGDPTRFNFNKKSAYALTSESNINKIVSKLDQLQKELEENEK